jgi:hypothetical protein
LPFIFSRLKSYGTKSWKGLGQIRSLVLRLLPIGSGFHDATGDATELYAAAIIAAAGDGIGSEENLFLIQEPAARLPHATVAGSRIVYDREWFGYPLRGIRPYPPFIIGKAIALLPHLPSARSGDPIIVAPASIWFQTRQSVGNAREYQSD